MHKLHAFFIAVQFLTRIPVPQMQQVSDKNVGRSMLYYPLVGLIIGVFLFSVAWLSTTSSTFLSAALVLGTWVLITGALHLDGLADSADAWIGGNGDVERSLEIMKDPYSGPVAVVVLLLVLLLKLTAIESIISSGDLLLLLIAPVIARALMPLLLLTTPYVRNIGLGTAMVENLPPKKAVYTLLLLCALFSLYFVSITVVIAAAICFFLIRKIMMNRLGGTTGDTAGALLEISETVMLVAIVFQKNN